jgi:hypothetical protein
MREQALRQMLRLLTLTSCQDLLALVVQSSGGGLAASSTVQSDIDLVSHPRALSLPID